MDKNISQDRIEIAFRQEPNLSGWIDLYLTINDVQKKIETSEVFPPYEDLLKFLEDIADGHLPTSFILDEEGKLKQFKAKPHSNPNIFYFILESPSQLSGFPEHTYLQGIFHKKEFISEFYTKFTAFIEYGYNKERWSKDESLDLKKLNLEKLRKFILD